MKPGWGARRTVVDRGLVLDWEGALARVGGDAEFLEELVGCFLVDLEGYVRDLAGAPPGPQARAAAHRIKGAARNVGAEALADAAEAAEGSEGAPEDVAAVEREADRLRRYWKERAG